VILKLNLQRGRTTMGQGQTPDTPSEMLDLGPGPGFGLDFEGRVAIVTGGSRGIGRAIAEAFLRCGAEVVVCARKDPGAEAASTLPSWQGRNAVFIQADVRQAEQAALLVDEAKSRFGRVDILVNNAGGSPSVPAADASPRFIRSVIELNLLAPFFCAQAANAVMQAQDAGGQIINIGSVSGTRPSPGTAAYGAAKAGLANLTTTLAMEWAPKVRVNCLVGGLIATENGGDHYGGAQGIAAVAATVPLGRMGTPDDVAGLCLLLASPLASFVSGAVLLAHGGGERPPYLTSLE
jgi:NAD(P)-dependent dehydrogenase (short-subunit alcohol dehydrogenase family)